jgi:hypothetical protein
LRFRKLGRAVPAAAKNSGRAGAIVFAHALAGRRICEQFRKIFDMGRGIFNVAIGVVTTVLGCWLQFGEHPGEKWFAWPLVIVGPIWAIRGVVEMVRARD